MDSADPLAGLVWQAFENQKRATLIVHRDGTVAAINQIARMQLLGTSSGPPAPLPVLLNKTPEVMLRDLLAAASGGHLVATVQGSEPGLVRRLRYEVTPMREGTEPIRYFLLSQERTSDIQEAFVQINKSMRNANIAAAHERRERLILQQSFKELEQFSYAAAHDLKAPLRTISMLLDCIEQDFGADMKADATAMLRTAQTAAERLQRLISALLDHARSNRATLARKTVDLSAAIRAVEDTLSAALQGAGGRIEIAGDLGEVNADPDLLQKLLENLIGNALKYRAADRPPIVGLSRLTTETGTEAIEIRDNGQGFDNAYLDKIFEPFQRLHAASKIEGSGVGLATARAICERHGWRLAGHGDPDRGAVFTITLPRDQPASR